MNQDQVKELFDYNPRTGVLLYKHDVGCKIKSGQRAGSLRNDGYRRVIINGKAYYEARIIYLYMTGSFPEHEIDHINRVRDDNRWCNLVNATSQQNSENRCDNNPVIGVYFDKQQGKWRAYSTGKKKYLGIFKYYLQACIARFGYDSLKAAQSGRH